MTPSQLSRLLRQLQWTPEQAAAYLRVHPRTVNRWRYAERAIPSPVEVALTAARAFQLWERGPDENADLPPGFERIIERLLRRTRRPLWSSRA